MRVFKDLMWLIYLITKYRYTNSYFVNGTRIKATNVGLNLKIGKSVISNSILGNNVIVDDSCFIHGTSIDDFVHLYSGCAIKDSDIGRFTYVSGLANINYTSIGNFCSIAAHLLCGLGDHPTNFLSTHPSFFSTTKQCGVTFSDKDYYSENQKITIGSDVWIGARVFIRDGVTIGNGAIIGAGSVVTKDVPDYAIVGGVPAKIIRFRYPDDIIAKLMNIEWWNWEHSLIKETQCYFIKNNVDDFIAWYDANLNLMNR